MISGGKGISWSAWCYDGTDEGSLTWENDLNPSPYMNFLLCMVDELQNGATSNAWLELNIYSGIPIF